jgi:hypothetical protein
MDMRLNLMKKKKDNYRHQKESYQQMIAAGMLQKIGGISLRNLQNRKKQPVSTD